MPISLGGDLIVAFAGQKVERAADIARIVTDSLRPGQTVVGHGAPRGQGSGETVASALTERPLNPTR